MSGWEMANEAAMAYPILADYSPRTFLQNGYERLHGVRRHSLQITERECHDTVPESYTEDTKCLRESEVFCEELSHEQPEHSSSVVTGSARYHQQRLNDVGDFNH